MIYKLLLLSFILGGCNMFKTQNCDNINNMTKTEIKNYLNIDSKNELVMRIYQLGECKKIEAIPYIETFTEDVRITHLMKFKGMSVGYIAKKSIEKIQKEK